MSKPFVVSEQDCPPERWENAASSLKWRTLISGDRNPTSALTLGVAELAPGDGHEPRWHSHAQPEVYYVLQGQGVVNIDGEEHPVESGSAVFIPGNALHGSRNTGVEPMRILYVFPADSFDEVEYPSRSRSEISRSRSRAGYRPAERACRRAV